MLKHIKRVVLVLFLLFVFGYTTYSLRDKVVFVANKTSLSSGTLDSYVLSLYARYQLQPDTSKLKFSLNLLLSSDGLSNSNKEVVQSMLDYIEQHKSYSEKIILDKLASLKLVNISHDISFMGLNFSGLVKEKSNLEYVIDHVRWAVLTHNNLLYHNELAKLSGYVENAQTLKDLQSMDINLPELPWQQWLHLLSS